MTNGRGSDGDPGVSVEWCTRHSRAFSQRPAGLGRGKPSEVNQMTERYRSFKDFYPFYLSEHANRVSRRLHFAGTSIALLLLIAAFATHRWWLLGLALIQGYAFAWVGHFFFEHNKPATFKYPAFSLMGDWRLWWDILSRRIPL
jgi:hypothetical protein